MRLSRHARNNMRFYDIMEADLTSAIEAHDHIEVAEGKMTVLKMFPGKFSGYPLKVVFQKVENEIIIVTAYPLKKALRRRF